MLGQALTFGISDHRIRMQGRMIRLIGHVVEHPDKIGQHFHIARAVIKAARKAKLPRPMPGHLADGNHHIPCAVPSTALLSVEAVSACTGVGEGCVDMTVTINAQVSAAALPSKLARVQMRVAPAFGQRRINSATERRDGIKFDQFSINSAASAARTTTLGPMSSQPRSPRRTPSRRSAVLLAGVAAGALLGATAGWSVAARWCCCTT